MIRGGLIAVLLLALLGLGIASYIRRRRRVARLIGDRELTRALTGLDLGTDPWLRLALVALAGLAIGGALLDPAVTGRRSASQGSVVLLMDASGSMLADDAGGRRLDAARTLAHLLVQALPDTPVGVVAFAGRAFSLTPPTRDAGALRMYLDAVDPTVVIQTGSASSLALRQGLGLLSTSGNAAGGTLILLGDGDETDNRDEAFDAASLARRAGVAVHTVGVGGSRDVPVPAFDPATGEIRGFLTGDDGQPLTTRRSDAFLRGLARRGGGTDFVLDGSAGGDRSAQAIVRELTIRVRRSAGGADSSQREGVPLYVWLAAGALALLLAEPWLAVRELQSGPARTGPGSGASAHPAEAEGAESREASTEDSRKLFLPEPLVRFRSWISRILRIGGS
ncbi:MAG: VWA domain-containing protein [Gemmatimonadota bacterium]|jgi:Ca-activated chloride channel family protein|nr:VWA domain-containing protein [Gemmatimonadota bacterium]